MKYKEDEIVKELLEAISSTYEQHYKKEYNDIQCVDAWDAMGSAVTSSRDTAIKYLWRYGDKEGNNKKDLLKAMHFIVYMIYFDHYKGK